MPDSVRVGDLHLPVIGDKVIAREVYAPRAWRTCTTAGLNYGQ